MIHLEHLTKQYGSDTVVSDLTLTVGEGELLVLLGGSGSGKTTTLKMINRLIEPTSGTVLLDGTDTMSIPRHELRRQIGYAFQQVGLFPHLTVGENVGVTPSLLGWEPARVRARTDELLELVGLDPAVGRRRPHELSGGQQQRIGVARALAAGPTVMLLDEPFGALDPLTRERLQESFLGIRREIGLTAVFVTHDMVEALMLGDRIAVLQDGQLVQLGTPHELLTQPSTDYVRQLMSAPRRQAAIVEQLSQDTPDVTEQLALLPGYLTAHLQLTVLALLFSAIISLPLGIAASRWPRLEPPVLGVAGTIQTVPGLALLAVMVPVLAALDLQSIGFLPAIAGLTLYGVFPILRNTVTGLTGVDPALKEAAQAVGMTRGQQLVRVELPLAMPVIVAGLRTATVWLVGMTTLSTPIGATSLGNYIFSGLQTRNYTAVLVGCVSAAGLALLLDGTIRAIERGITHRRRRPVLAALAVVTTLGLYVTVTLATPLIGERTRPIVIGSKTFTEQYILSAILAQWIEQRTDLPTALMQSLGSTVAFDALDAGEIDLYVDYSGTLWANEMGRASQPASRQDVLGALEQYLRLEHDITLVATLGFENAYALAIRNEDAERLNLQRISDLVAHAPAMDIGGDYEFFARPEWTALQEAYRLSFAEHRTMDSTFMYQAVAQHNVDVISAFTSDGRVAAYELTLLEDDLDAIPPYDAVVLASSDLVRRHPDIIRAIAQLDGAIGVEEMRTMNLAVDESSAHPSAVAEDFVRTLNQEK